MRAGVPLPLPRATVSVIAITSAIAIAAMLVAAPTSAATYRCDADGRTTYGDRPCTTGRQSDVAIDPATPTAADRAAAAARLRSDRAAVAALERERDRPGPTTRRVGADRNKQVDACKRLTLRAKRAHEDLDQASLKEQASRRVRSRRADEDLATFCKR